MATINMSRIIPWIVTLVFCVVGIVTLFFPRKIQKIALRPDPRRPRILKWYPSKEYVAQERYVWELRLIGISTLAVGFYCIWILCGGK